MAGPPARPAPSDPAVIGRVVRPHGIAGELVIDLLARDAGGCEQGADLWIAGRWRRVSRRRFDNKGRALVAVAGVDDRDAAEALRGAEVVIDAPDLPALETDRFYVHDLVGCRVEDPDGNALGEVVAVVNGPQDLLEIEHEGRRSLLPMTPDLLHEVDVGGRRIVADPPRGLLDVTRA